MKEGMIRYLQSAYKHIVTRGAIWINRDGQMYSDYSNVAHLEFLARFTPPIQRQIAGKSLDDMKKDCRSSMVEKALDKLGKEEIEDLLTRLKGIGK